MDFTSGLYTSAFLPILHQNRIIIGPSEIFQDRFESSGRQQSFLNSVQNQDKKQKSLSNQSSDEDFSLCQSSGGKQSCGKRSFGDMLLQQRRRKNKTEKLRQIKENRSDDGRGGNCVASNICKTLLRIIACALLGEARQQFDKTIKKYQIRSQKQNTIILILILHVLVKRNMVQLRAYEEIVRQFFESLSESERNCDKKIRQETQRRGFHMKNRKMYVRFAEIDRELYDRSVKNILDGSQCFELKQLEEIISQTYDRKQREVQKAMGKIKSLILNYNQLKQFFNYYEIDVEEGFFESIDFAFRRNLPKRCKQMKERARLVMEKFKRESSVCSDNEKYMMCYMTLKLLGEKENEIWREFVKNLLMKMQFNHGEKELAGFKNFLEKVVPEEFQKNICKKETISNRAREMSQHELKIEEETNIRSNQTALVSTYEELKETFQF